MKYQPRTISVPVIAITAFLLAAPFTVYPAAEQPRVELESSIDRDRVNIGDPIIYTISVTAPEGARVEFEEIGAVEGGEFEVEPAGGGLRDDEERTRSVRYLLRGFEPGSFRLPPASAVITLPGGGEIQLTAPPLSVEIESLLGSGVEKAEIRDIKPPFELESSSGWIVYLLAVGAGALIAAAVIIRLLRKRNGKFSPPPPPPPPHVIAYRELDRIRSADLPGRGLIKEYYSRLSGVTRHYLEDRFGLRAPEMTTEEFLRAAAATDHLSLPQQDLVGDFLSQADLVKFARHRPREKEIDGVYQSARRLVDETREGAEEDGTGDREVAERK